MTIFYGMLTAMEIIPANEYRLLLAEVLKKSPEWIFMHLPTLVLSKQQQQQLDTLIQRRLSGEPVAKILGHKEFYGRDFFTNAHTLDPRPDSEVIIDAVKKYFSAHTFYQILDLGLGTGCLLFTLLCEFPKAFGIGVDCSWEALRTAKSNQEKLQLTQRSQLIQGHWAQSLHGQFNIIISNPPYISTQEQLDISTLHDPKIALFSGATGLEAYQEILSNIRPLLKPEGLLFLEIGKGQKTDIENIASTAGLIQKDAFADLSGIVRTLCYSSKKTKYFNFYE